ncbi:MAG: PAS domain S-box protein, partial [Bacteroidia bacterium]|nr:PAS domain S-box protein [Bacteroidia bacterium]
MTSTKQIRSIAIIGLVLLVSAAVGWGWILRQVEQGNQTALQDLYQVERHLLQVELTVWLQDLRIRSMLLTKLTGQDVPLSLLRQADLRSALKGLEKEAKPYTRLGPILRELLERGYILERRYASWRRSLEQVEKAEQVLPIYEQYIAGASALISSVENEVRRLREAVESEQSQLIAENQRSISRIQSLGLLGIGVLLVGGIVALLLIGRAEESQAARLLSAPINEPLPEEPGPWLELARSYNQLLLQVQVLRKAVYHLAEQGGLWDEDKARLPNDTLSHFQAILERESKQEERVKAISEEKRKILQQLQATEKHLSEQIEELRIEVGALQNLFPLAEVDEKGNLTNKNDLWLQLSLAQSWNNVSDIHSELATFARDGASKQGVLPIGDSLFAYAYIAYRHGKHRRAFLSLMEVGQVMGRMREMENALAQAQRRLGEVEGILAQLRQQQSQLQVRHSQEAERLLRQRQSLQTLLKLPALQSGSVIEGLSAIAEVAATLEPEARYSFWVFSEGGMHCLEAYDPALLTHSNTIDLPAEVANWVRKQFSGNVPVGPYAVESSPLAPYLSDRKAVWLFPLYLDEELVGAFFIEGVAPDKELDTEYPLLLARVASLLLQQGHRKLVEQEMLSYIEQAHALEEELRQNIEELEASAEEMRRTQAELRGQITALNTAALVIEMNPEGRIIYVNDAFLRLFGQTVDKVLGIPYVRLRKEEERPLMEEVFARLRQGEVWQEMVYYTNALGQELWLQQTIVPVRHLTGEVYKYILVGFDITLQKQQELEIQHALTIAREHEQLLRENTEELRRSNENYRASQLQLSAQMEALNSAAWLFETDAEGHISYITQGFAEAMGYTPDKLKGMSYGMLFSERQPLAILQGHWRSMQVGQMWKSEVELKGALGQSYWAIMSSTPIIDRSRGERRSLLKTINVLFD